MVDIAKIRKKATKARAPEQKKADQHRQPESSPGPEEPTALTTETGPTETAPQTPVSPPSTPPPDVPPVPPPVDLDDMSGSSAEPQSRPAQVTPEDSRGETSPFILQPAEIIARLMQGTEEGLLLSTAGPASYDPKRYARFDNAYLVFKLLDEYYAVPLPNVVELVRFRSYTWVPGAPPYILGVMNLRGRMIIVYHTPMRLGITTPITWTNRSRVIIIKDDGDELVGLAIENYAYVVDISSDAFYSPPMHLHKKYGSLIKVVTRIDQHVIALLDINNFLTSAGFATDQPSQSNAISP